MPGKRLTTQEARKRLSNRGIELIGEWQGCGHKHSFKCTKGHTWTALSHGLSSQGNCPECDRVSRRLNTKKLEKRLSARGIQLMGEWKGSSHKHVFKCDKGHTWETKGSVVVSDERGCPECANLNRTLSIAEIRKRLKTREIELIGKWKGARKKNKFKCSQGHLFTAFASNLVNKNTGCPECVKLTITEVNERLKARNIVCISLWHGTAKYNTFKCSLGHVWKTTGNSVLNGESGCPECARLRQKNRYARGF